MTFLNWLGEYRSPIELALGSTATLALTEIQQSIFSAQPTILFMGPYNTYKSTTICAMRACEDAPIGITPTTNSIDAYQWHGYKLQDSPGINAPIEHEKVTDEAIKTADLILMFVSEDECDSEVVYERCAEMIGNQKRVAIVLTHNLLTSDLNDQKKLARIRHQIFHNLHKQSQLTEIDLLSELEVLELNSTLALQGRLANDQDFIENSGILLFENSVHKFVKDRSDTVSVSIRNQIQHKLLPPSIKALKIRETDPKFLELEIIHQQRLDIEESKTKLIEKTNTYSLRMIENLRLRLTSSLVNEDELAVENEISKYADHFKTWFEQLMQSSISDLSLKFSQSTESPSSGLKDIKAILDALTKSATPNCFPGGPKDPIRDGTDQVAKLILQLLGKLSKYISRWTPYILQAFSVIALIKEFQSTQKQHASYEQKMAMIRQQVQLLLDQMHVKLIDISKESVNKLFEK